MFCEKCGKQYNSANFCSECGQDLRENEESMTKENTTKESAEKPGLKQFIKSFNHFKSEKGTMWKARVTKKKPENKQPKVENVNINIGLYEWDEKNKKLTVRRGKRILCTVATNDDALNIRIKSEQKFSKFHCNLYDELFPYELLYESGEVVEFLPGSNEKFVLSKYKEELGKDYKRITLYLCKSSDIIISKFPLPNDDEEIEENPPKKTKTSEHDLDMYLLPYEDNIFDGLNEEGFNLPGPSTQQPGISTVQSEISTQQLGISTQHSGISTQQPGSSTEQLGISTESGPSARHFMFCPICNKRFDMAIIETHADQCSSMFSTAFDVDNELELIEDVTPSSNTEVITPITRNTVRDLLLNEFEPNQNNLKLRVEVRRAHCFDDFKRFFDRKWNIKRKNQRVEISFIGEAGVDTGGVGRDFFCEALSQVKQRFFVGNDSEGHEPSCGMLSVVDGTLSSIGHLFSASIVNGGQGPHYLAPWLFDYLAGREITPTPTITGTLSSFYEKLMKCFDNEQIHKLFSQEDSWDVLEIIGFKGNPLKATLSDKDAVIRSVFVQAKIQPLSVAISELSKGLETYGLLDLIKKHPDVFSHIFCSSDLLNWTTNLFFDKLCPTFSEEGSTKKENEINLYKWFKDFIERCFEDDTYEIDRKTVMRFLTGAEKIPPTGMPSEYTIHFKHDCPVNCKCFPTVSTCGYVVSLPMHVANDEDFFKIMEISVNSEPGFGRV